MECCISRLCFRHVLFLLQRRLSASTVHGLNQKYQVCKEFIHLSSCLFCFHLFRGCDCLSEPRTSSLLSYFPFLVSCLFQIFTFHLSLSPLLLSLVRLPRSASAPFYPWLVSLTVAFPIPLPLICVLSLPQSQIIPSLWNWKIAAGESKREIILPD